MSELKIKPRICEVCGAKYVPTGTRQRLCPDCSAGRHKYAAAKKPGDVEHYTLGETPEQAMPEPEIPEKPKPAHSISVDVEVDTEQVDDAIEKADELGEAMARIAPEVSIVRPSGCTFIFNVGGGKC